MTAHDKARDVAVRLLCDLRRDIAAECAQHLDLIAAQLEAQAKDVDGAARSARTERARNYHLAADDLRRHYDIEPRDAA